MLLDLFYPPKPPKPRPTLVIRRADIEPPLSEVYLGPVYSGPVEIRKHEPRPHTTVKTEARLARLDPDARQRYAARERERYQRNRARILEVLRVKRERHAGPKLTPEQVRDRRNARKRELRALAKLVPA